MLDIIFMIASLPCFSAESHSPPPPPSAEVPLTEVGIAELETALGLEAAILQTCAEAHIPFPSLLMDNRMVPQLGLSHDQQHCIKTAIQEYVVRLKSLRLVFGASVDLKIEGGRDSAREFSRQATRLASLNTIEVCRILSKDQKLRLLQILLQLAGPRVFDISFCREKFVISQNQISELEAARMRATQKIALLVSGNKRKGLTQEQFTSAEEIESEWLEECHQVMATEQRKCLRELLGSTVPISRRSIPNSIRIKT